MSMHTSFFNKRIHLMNNNSYFYSFNHHEPFISTSENYFSNETICFDGEWCLPDRSSPAINLTVGLTDRQDYQLKLSATWDCYWCLASLKKKEWETILLEEKSRHWCNLSIVETLSSPVALSGQTNIYSETESTHSFTLALFSAPALLID